MFLDPKTIFSSKDKVKKNCHINIAVTFLALFTLFLASNIGNATPTKIIIDEIRKEKSITDKEKLKVVKKEIHESTEGGIRKYYYKGNALKKIIEEHYGEGGKLYRELYIKNNRIYFIYSMYTIYNSHILSPKFNEKKSKIEEERYYFNKQGVLIRYIDENNKIHENRDFLNQKYLDLKESLPL